SSSPSPLLSPWSSSPCDSPPRLRYAGPSPLLKDAEISCVQRRPLPRGSAQAREDLHDTVPQPFGIPVRELAHFRRRRLPVPDEGDLSALPSRACRSRQSRSR